MLAGEGLGLDDGDAAAGLARPEGLDVGEDGDYLLVGEGFSEGRHDALEAGDGEFGSAVADDAVEEAVGVMPGVAVAVERGRGKGAVGVTDVPVGLTFAVDAVAGGAVGNEERAAGWWGGVSGCGSAGFGG